MYILRGSMQYLCSSLFYLRHKVQQFHNSIKQFLFSGWFSITFSNIIIRAVNEGPHKSRRRPHMYLLLVKSAYKRSHI